VIQAISLKDAEAFGQLTLAIVGAPKSGKSTLASTGRKPMLFLDYDLRSEAIAGKANVFAVKMIDPPLPQTPTSIPDTFDILSSIERSKKVCDLSTAGGKLFPNADPSLELKTLVVDSANSIAKRSLNWILSSSKEIRHELNVAARPGSNAFVHYTPKSWIGWVADVGLVESILIRCIATGLDTIVILHEAPEEAADSTEESPKFTGHITVYPVRYGRLLINFNEVWRMKLIPGGPGGRYVPQVRVAQDWDFNASTCLQLDPVEKPDIAVMLAKQPTNVR